MSSQVLTYPASEAELIDLESRRAKPAPSFADQLMDLKHLRMRSNDVIRARTGLTNRVHAICRRMVGSKGKDDEAGLKKARALYARTRAVITNGPQPDTDSEALYVASLTQAYFAALVPLDAEDAAIRKAMIKIADGMPAIDWVKSIKGFGVYSFACILGECGDLGNQVDIEGMSYPVQQVGNGTGCDNP